jgi:bifunctional non-homologous end joining protein LigD
MRSAAMLPMLVTSAPLRPDSEQYSFEVKWDGFRALVCASSEGTSVVSRNGNDMTHRYPELRGLGPELSTHTVLDGEIVVLGDQGMPDFAALWFRSRGHARGQLCFMIFDILKCGDRLLIDATYAERRDVLEHLHLLGSHWCTPPAFLGKGESLFAATKELGLEGVVAKRVGSRYRPGLRSRSWTKTFPDAQLRSCGLVAST